MRKLSIILKVFLYCLPFMCCTNDEHKREAVHIHFSDSLLQNIQSKINTGWDIKKANDYIDSIYRTFPKTTVADRYQYYRYKVKLVQNLNSDSHWDDTAIHYAERMVSVIEENKMTNEMHDEYVDACLITGNLFRLPISFDKAIDVFVKLKLFTQLSGDSCNLGKANYHLSLINMSRENFVPAISLTKEAISELAFCKPDNQWYKNISSWTDLLGVAYRGKFQYDSALKYHFKAVNYIIQYNERFKEEERYTWLSLENIYGNIALVYKRQQDYKNAEKYLRIAIAICDKHNKPANDNVVNYLYLAQVLLKSGKVKEAEMFVEKMRNGLDRFSKQSKMEWLGIMADIAKKRKNVANEIAYERQRYLLRDTILTRLLEENKKREPNTEYENQEKKFRLQQLSLENKLQQNKTNTFIIIGVLLFVLILISLFALRSIRNVLKKRAIIYKELIQRERDLQLALKEIKIQEKQKKEEALYFQELRLQLQHNEAIIKQRHKISEDLHDDLSNSLVALRFYVDNMKDKADNEGVKKILVDIGNELKTIYQDARSYMHSLQQGARISSYDLPLLMEEMQLKFSQKTSLIFELDIDKKKMASELNIEQNDQLYYIVNEAITNIIKHAGATKIKVVIGFLNNFCKFSIEDNGHGMTNPISDKAGLGLQTMQKRIHELEGNLYIESGKPGTIISGEFPLI